MTTEQGLGQLTVSELRARVASGRPTPGGGSVCATCASLGLGLVVMALEIARRHRSEEGERARLDALLAEARPRVEALGEAADEDVRAFAGYMAAHRLPQASDDQARTRREALRRASIAAIESPLSVGEHVRAALIVANEAAGLVTEHVLSDVSAGAELLTAAGTGVLHTIEMNLRALDDEAVIAGYRARRDALDLAAREAGERVRARVRARLSASPTR